MDLYPWQSRELLDKRPRKMIFAAPRLGKTMVGAQWLMEHLREGNVLVISPLSVCPAWVSILEGLSEALDGFKVLPLYKTKLRGIPGLVEALRRQKTGLVLVTNIDRVASNKEWLKSAKFRALVLDESHLIKSPGSQRGKAVRQLAALIPYVRLLTGTPAPNGPQDLWGQMTIVNPLKWEKSFSRFKQRHLIEDGNYYSKIIGTRDPELLQAMFDADSSTYKREDVFGPDSWQIVKRHLELPANAQALYRQAVREWTMVQQEDRIDLDVNHTLSRMMRLQQLTSGFLPDETGVDTQIHDTKIQAVLDDLEDIITAGEKVVIFHRYRWEGDQYAERIKAELGTDVFRLYGDTPPEQRARDISAFNDRRGGAVYVVQTAAGGVGISLATATHAFFVSQYFSFDVERQARDRIYSPVKSRCITYYRCLNTIDMYIASLLEYKKTWHEALSNSTINDVAYGALTYTDR